MVKKLAVLLLIIIIGFSAKSQTVGGISVGLNLATWGHSEVTPSPTLGYFVGFNLDYTMDSNYYFGTTPQISRVGCQLYINDTLVKYQVHYIKVPFYVMQVYPFETLNIFFRGGPYFSLGLSGKYKYEDQEESIYFGDRADYLKPIDYGVSLGGGIQTDNVQFGIGIDVGVYDIANSGSISIFNRSVNASVLFRW